MLHHSVLQILPSLFALLWIWKDVCGRAFRWALTQLLPIILHQGGPAHQLHRGKLFQKVPMNGRWRYYKNLPVLKLCSRAYAHDVRLYLSCYIHFLLSSKHTSLPSYIPPGTKIAADKTNWYIVYLTFDSDSLLFAGGAWSSKNTFEDVFLQKLWRGFSS